MNTFGVLIIVTLAILAYLSIGSLVYLQLERRNIGADHFNRMALAIFWFVGLFVMYVVELYRFMKRYGA